jgi:RNA polymerase II elongation factor ELL
MPSPPILFNPPSNSNLVILLCAINFFLLYLLPCIYAHHSLSQGIHIGSTFFPMRGVPESTQHELYLRSALASKINAPLKLYADIAGKFTVDRELNGKAESKVHQSTADAQKSKSGGRIRLLEAPPTLKPSIKAKSSAPPKKRKTAVSAPIAATVKRVPVRVKNEGSSAARGQSPPPPLPTSQSTSTVSPVMRAHMIHLLAKGSRTKEDVLTQVGGPDASESLRVQLNELLVTVSTLSTYSPYFPLTW